VTSAAVRAADTGVLSSCEASVMNCRWLSTAAETRPSSRLKARPSWPTSSPESGMESPEVKRLDGRALGFVAHLRQGAHASDATTSRRPPTGQRRRHAHQQRPRQHCLLARNRRFGGGDENHERTVGGILALQPHAPCLRALLDRACQSDRPARAGQLARWNPPPVAGDGVTDSIEDDHRADSGCRAPCGCLPRRGPS